MEVAEKRGGVVQDYEAFLHKKKFIQPSAGIKVDPKHLNPNLFEFQRDLVAWGLSKGKVAFFEDAGLGKTIQQMVWAEQVVYHTGKPVLILAPLSVGEQTVGEAAKFGIGCPVVCVRHQDEITDPQAIYVTNYEILHHFDASVFGGVVLDESSIFKNFEGVTCNKIIEAFENTPYKLCCTATPVPNDVTELAPHARFLTDMSRTEMLAAFFIHDDSGWRLKGHAKRGPFYEWLSSWAVALQKPSQLGYSDEGYELPGLEINPIFVKSDYVPAGKLFHDKLSGIKERKEVRKATIKLRIERTVELIKNSPANEQWLLWCGLNDEGRQLAKLLPEAVLVEGADKPDHKAQSLLRFAKGQTRILITKPSIAGFGLNFQSCNNMAFVGLSDSYEEYYQAIRRCYRFGQTRTVKVHIVLSDVEQDIYQNVLRKQKEANELTAELVNQVRKYGLLELGRSAVVANSATTTNTDAATNQLQGLTGRLEYMTKTVDTRNSTLMLGDSAIRLKELANESVDFSVFSPPFASLYTYSPSEHDLGNCKDYAEFWQHFGFITPEIFRVMKPGRIVACHVSQVALQKAKDGVIGLIDFRGDVIRHFTDHGFIYHGEVTIDKDPQAQAIRTRTKGLAFQQLHKDSSWMRPALADYIVQFRKPGDNAVPVIPDVTNDEWIEWARPIWYGIKETDTLNAAEGSSKDDAKHPCPLQLGAIERCVRLWSNPGEIVLTPFLGIGSEVYQSVKFGRKGIGIELNPVSFGAAVKNVERMEGIIFQPTLLDLMAAAS